jgi:hypothetical protein
VQKYVSVRRFARQAKRLTFGGDFVIIRLSIPLAAVAWLLFAALAPANPSKTRVPKYPWQYASESTSIGKRFSPPQGYRRVETPNESFGHWLKHLPVKPGKPPVRLFNGARKGNQDAHVAVLDIDVGKRNLQQCADAAIRVWAEYLLSIHREDLVCFRTAAGSRAKWSKWREGYRPSRSKPRTWRKSARPTAGYHAFKKYLTKVFGIANSASILAQMEKVGDQMDVHHGDVYIQGASKQGYGHVVIVMDVAENRKGEKVFLLAQSYMPAQEIHILKNPNNPTSPWYTPTADGALETPEWTFGPGSLHRFKKGGC